jgi:Flp pilus assembly protein TadB
MTRPQPFPPRAGRARTTGLEAGVLVACVTLAVGGLLLAMEAGTAHHAAAGPGRSATPRPVASSSPAVIDAHRSLALIGVLASVFVALMLIGLLLAGSLLRDHRGKQLADRVASYTRPGPPAGPEADGASVGTAAGWVARLLRSGRTEKRLAERLDLAGISRKPAEWVLLGGVAGLMLAVVLTVLAGSPVIGVLGGALLSWAGMRLVLSLRIARRRAAFAEQLPDLLQLVAGSLKSGFSLAQGLDAVIREGTQPASSEFARALSLARLGVDQADALQRVADRMDCLDLRWAVMVIRIQREVGGRLAEVLTTAVSTMRERSHLRNHVKALSAEGRLSAYILVALPVLIGVWMFTTDRPYMRLLYTNTIGIVMLAGAVFLIGVGALWMRKVIRVEM